MFFLKCQIAPPPFVFARVLADMKATHQQQGWDTPCFWGWVSRTAAGQTHWESKSHVRGGLHCFPSPWLNCETYIYIYISLSNMFLITHICHRSTQWIKVCVRSMCDCVIM